MLLQLPTAGPAASAGGRTTLLTTATRLRNSSRGARTVGVGDEHVLETVGLQLGEHARSEQRRVEVAVAGRAPLVTLVLGPRRGRQ
eukprot:1290834-Prymnesium_polylepis.1